MFIIEFKLNIMVDHRYDMSVVLSSREGWMRSNHHDCLDFNEFFLKKHFLFTSKKRLHMNKNKIWSAYKRTFDNHNYFNLFQGFLLVNSTVTIVAFWLKRMWQQKYFICTSSFHHESSSLLFKDLIVKISRI